MKREVGIDEISDGKLYGPDDLVKAGCNDCKDCSACCHDMGNSIILDPFDIYRLTTGLSMSFEELLQGKAELQVDEGMILVNLKMKEEGSCCPFLNDEGRCSIHSLRPGLCRLFPLGRIYEEDGFRYFLQVNECLKTNRTKIKVRKWLDTPNLKRYEQFVMEWHELSARIKEKIAACNNQDTIKAINMSMLQLFYIQPYGGEEDFYLQFEHRLADARNRLFAEGQE